jgi:hypothetical protein
MRSAKAAAKQNHVFRRQRFVSSHFLTYIPFEPRRPPALIIARSFAFPCLSGNRRHLMAEERKKVWIDPFQTKLTLRIAGYLALFFVVFFNLLFAWKMLDEGPIDPARQFVETVQTHLPVFICLLFLVPIMTWDTIRFTHRLIGPLVRFRKTMQAMAQGEPVRPIKLRDGDYLLEMRDDFNKMLEELQKQGVPVIKPTDPSQEQRDSQKITA